MGHEQTFVRVEGGEAYQDFGLQVELGEEIKIDMELISDQIRFAYLLEEYPLLPGGEIPPMASHVNAAGRILCLLGELEDHNLQI